MSGSGRKAVYGVITLLALLCLGIVLLRSGGGHALKEYKAELIARGEKLMVAEIAVPPSTNATEISARQILDSNPVAANPPLIISLMQYVAPGKARVTWRGRLSGIAGIGGSNVPTSTWEGFISQTEKAEPTLSILRGALEHSPPDTGWVWKDDFKNMTNWPGRTFVRDRAVCQYLFNAAMADLHQGRLDAAIANLHALTGLARMNRNELPLVSQMVRITIALAGMGTTWEALQAPGWDEPRLAALQHDWEGVTFMDGLERSFEGARAMDVVRMAKVRNSSLRELGQIIPAWETSIKSPWTNSGNIFRRFANAAWFRSVALESYRLTSVNADELLQLQFASGDLDDLRRVRSGRPWPEIQPLILARYTNLDVQIQHDVMGRLLLSRLVIPNMASAMRTAARAETQRRLTITAITLKRYQLKHNVAPPNLDALVPEFLTEVPMDPMSGKPLCYRLNADGTFVLYSVGDDGRDDGGVAAGKPGLWDGLDAVWPTAETEEEQAAADGAR